MVLELSGSRMSLEGGTEIEDFPEDAWIIPSPIELGRTWSTSTPDRFRWSRIDDLNGPNPNPLYETEGCLVKLTVAAERLPSGELAAEVEMSHWARGHGVVWIDQWRGTLDGIDEALTIDEQTDQVLDRLAELPESVTIQAIPQEEAE